MKHIMMYFKQRDLSQLRHDNKHQLLL